MVMQTVSNISGEGPKRGAWAQNLPTRKLTPPQNGPGTEFFQGEGGKGEKGEKRKTQNKGNNGRLRGKGQESKCKVRRHVDLVMINCGKFH